VILSLVFGVLLLIAVLISERARTTVLSTSVLFLLAGIALGRTWLGWVTFPASEDVLGRAAEIALFAILLVDGSQLGCREIVRAWHLPGRALMVGLPLTIGAIAVAAHWILGFGWLQSLLLGAVLSPTDPVMTRAILEHDAVPLRLRRLLSVESGLNDGLALPPIIVLLGMLGASGTHPLRGVVEAVGGVAIGLATSAIVAVERLRWFEIAEGYRPLVGVAIGCTIFGICKLTGGNEFLAAYAAGVALATLRGDLAAAFVRVGEPISEVIKLAALLVFGVTLSLGLDPATLAFAAIALLVARPVALLFAFLGGGLPRREWVTAAWFGPKGFASMLYAVVVLDSGVPGAQRLYTVIGSVVTLSILAHSSTDSIVARAFAGPAARGEPLP
jgi:NhaP-type Na+/H+ or K+/H+ antiporter